MLGCNLIHIMTILTSKQDMAFIKITQIRILLSIVIFSPPGYPYKVSHIKIKPPRIIKIPLSSPCQGWNYSLINSTKIKCQTHHLHEYWKHIWHSCLCCICHESSIWRAWNQISRPCDLILPWQSRTPPTIPPYISSSKKRDLSIGWRNSKNKQPHR